jgi:hypothetical protein
MSYWTKGTFVPVLHLGAVSIIREEERPALEAMCGLPAFECCHHQEQVSVAPHRHSL